MYTSIMTERLFTVKKIFDWDRIVWSYAELSGAGEAPQRFDDDVEVLDKTGPRFPALAFVFDPKERRGMDGREDLSAKGGGEKVPALTADTKILSEECLSGGGA